MENIKKVNYSELARIEGYDFSTLTPEQQEMTYELYGGVDFMEELYKACIAYNDYCDHKLQDCDFTHTWGFPESGEYFGIILNCERSWKKDSVDYIMRIIVNNRETKFIKFKMIYQDPVYRAIRDLIVHNPGMAPCFNGLYGRMIALEIENVTESSIRKYDTPYSVVENAKVLSQEEDDTVCAMFNLMLEQSNNDEGADKSGC